MGNRHVSKHGNSAVTLIKLNQTNSTNGANSFIFQLNNGRGTLAKN